MYNERIHVVLSLYSYQIVRGKVNCRPFIAIYLIANLTDLRQEDLDLFIRRRFICIIQLWENSSLC